MTKNKTSIKELAKSAKERLTNSKYKEKSKFYYPNIVTFSNTNNSEDTIIFNKIDPTFREDMINKIFDLLSNDDEILNPLAQLVDYDYFSNLDELSKQKYILEIANIYTEAKKSYYNKKFV